MTAAGETGKRVVGQHPENGGLFARFSSTAAMLGAALADTQNIPHPEAAGPIVQSIGQYGPRWLRDPDDARGVVLREFTAQLVEMVRRADAEGVQG